VKPSCITAALENLGLHDARIDRPPRVDDVDQLEDAHMPGFVSNLDSRHRRTHHPERRRLRGLPASHRAEHSLGYSCGPMMFAGLHLYFFWNSSATGRCCLPAAELACQRRELVARILGASRTALPM